MEQLSTESPQGPPDAAPRTEAETAPARRLDRGLRILLLVLLVPCYLRGLASDAFTFGDETYWTAHGFKTAELVLVRHDFTNPFWTYGRDARVLEKTGLPFFLMPPTRVPKLGLFLIGSSVLLLDAPEPLPRQYVFNRPLAWNREHERLPPLATLAAARLPSAALGVVAALCLYSVLLTLLSPGWAFAGALLFALNPLVHWYSRLATIDAIAASFSIVAILFTIRACERPDRWAPVLLAGVFACAAVSSKLNAGILAPVLVVAFLLETWRQRAPRLIWLGAASAALAALLFVALNPTLYRGPWAGLVSMLNVGSELADVRLFNPRGLLPDVPSRIVAARDLLLGPFGTLRPWLGAHADRVALLLGLAVLAWRAVRNAAARVVLLWLGVAIAAVSLWTPMRFERYYLPAVAPIAVTEMLAVAFVLGLAGRAGARWLRALARGGERRAHV